MRKHVSFRRFQAKPENEKKCPRERKSVDAGTKATGLNRYTFREIIGCWYCVILCNYVRVSSLSVKELPLNINSY